MTRPLLYILLSGVRTFFKPREICNLYSRYWCVIFGRLSLQLRGDSQRVWEEVGKRFIWETPSSRKKTYCAVQPTVVRVVVVPVILIDDQMISLLQGRTRRSRRSRIWSTPVWSRSPSPTCFPAGSTERTWLRSQKGSAALACTQHQLQTHSSVQNQTVISSWHRWAASRAQTHCYSIYTPA